MRNGELLCCFVMHTCFCGMETIVLLTFSFFFSVVAFLCADFSLMFVNASPADYNIAETAGSFEFALKCKQIKNSKSGASVESEEVRSLRAQLLQLQTTNGASAPTDLGSV